jgi:chemotaxis protein CheX
LKKSTDKAEIDILILVLNLRSKKHIGCIIQKGGLFVKAEFVNPFVGAAFDVLKSLGIDSVTKGELGVTVSPVKGGEVNVVIGVTGDLIGQIIMFLSEETALALASKMLMELPTESFDELAKSAIGELGNMVIGNAVTTLGDNGYICNLTPPALFMGRDVIVSTKDMNFLVIPLQTGFGDLKLNVALRERVK